MTGERLVPCCWRKSVQGGPISLAGDTHFGRRPRRDLVDQGTAYACPAQPYAPPATSGSPPRTRSSAAARAAPPCHGMPYAGLIRPREKHPRNSHLRRASKRETAGQAPAPLHEVRARLAVVVAGGRGLLHARRLIAREPAGHLRSAYAVHRRLHTQCRAPRPIMPEKRDGRPEKRPHPRPSGSAPLLTRPRGPTCRPAINWSGDSWVPMFQSFGDPDLYDRLARHPEPLRLEVECVDHPRREIDVDTSLF